MCLPIAQVLEEHFNAARIDEILSQLQLVFVGNSGRVTNLEQKALKLPSLRLDARVLYNLMVIRHALRTARALDGERIGSPPPSYAEMRGLLEGYEQRLAGAGRVRHIRDDSVELAAKPSDAAGVRAAARR